MHDPENKKGKTTKKKRFNELLQVIFSACSAKGWNYSLPSHDNVNWNYATVNVTRNISTDRITGHLEITINDAKVKISCIKTSFYSHGLKELYEAVWNEVKTIEWLEKKETLSSPEITQRSELALLLSLLKRFDIVARQFQQRHDHRSTIIIKDEYDVQDMLHGLLRAYFSNVYAEDYSPRNSGASSRVDFLLKNEQIVIEVKITSKNLSDKKLGEQLIIDIKRYQSHPSCKTLVCFVYDPEHNVKNPEGLEQDLSGKNGEIDVIVTIIPH